MNAYNASGSFAASANTVAYRNDRAPFRAVHADPTKDLHNARGLVIALLMSAACWAGVGLAFLL